MDIGTKLLLCSFVYTTTLMPVKERWNVDLVIMVFEEGDFLMLQSTNWKMLYNLRYRDLHQCMAIVGCGII